MLTTRQKIVKAAQEGDQLKSHGLSTTLGISRQTIASHLKKLVEQGILEKAGSTHNATYALAKKGPPKPRSLELQLIKKIKGLQEDEVYREVERRLNLKRMLNKNVRSIAYYSFSEMLNNAIDHSRAPQVEITVKLAYGLFLFAIRDRGIGALNNIRKTFHLANDFEAAEHLFKGKQTTMPERHSGQGIFFTSRIADRFALRSNRLEVTVDNDRDDSYFADRNPLKGTRVEFSIRQHSKKSLQRLFQSFANEDFEFDRNVVRVNLHAEKELISRSQARRLLAGLETFQRITFNFNGKTGMGQAFADEIFRVFAARHPAIQLDYDHASPAVEFMIMRARSGTL